MALELRQLRYFVTVAEEGHITRAAERLGIQQPPLSQQIKALETQLSVRLFDRKPRGVELTDAGRVLYEHAGRVLERAEEAEAALRRAAKGEVGRLAVGLTSSSSLNPFVLRVLRRFREQMPDVALKLEENATVDLVEGLRRGALDVAFVRSAAGVTVELKTHPLLDEEMVAALPSGHRLARAKSVSLAALAHEDFILYRRSQGPGLYDAIVTACGNAGFSPHVVQEAPRMLSTLSLVAAGLGVSIVPASMERLKPDGVVYKPLRRAMGLCAPIIMLHPDASDSVARARFIELVRRTR
jgi:DNA-binding transcriptional LysR family regulator